MRAAGGADELLEFIIESLVTKIALLFRDPFLQAKMRLDLEPRHGVRSVVVALGAYRASRLRAKLLKRDD